MVEKITAQMQETLAAEYAAHVAEYKGDLGKINATFFQFMQRQFDDFATISGAQMRGTLSYMGVYKPTSPRTEPKKRGKVKADLVAELNELLGQELSSASKLTMGDLGTLIEALSP